MSSRQFDSLADLEKLVGTEVAVSAWMAVEQPRITLFAEATDDFQWIHVDLERASEQSPYGGTIAHGFLTLSLLAPLFENTLSIGGASLGVNYGFNRVRFTAPVRSGEAIRARFALQRYDALDPGAQLTWSVTVERKNEEKPAIVAEWIMRRYP
jgi:acyl dehydratase